MCDTKCVCVSPHHGTQQEDRDSKRERYRGRKKKKRIVRREKKNPRLLKCKLIVRVHHKSPMIKVIATNAARATTLCGQMDFTQTFK